MDDRSLFMIIDWLPEEQLGAVLLAAEETDLPKPCANFDERHDQCQVNQ